MSYAYLHAAVLVGLVSCTLVCEPIGVAIGLLFAFAPSLVGWWADGAKYDPENEQ